MFQVVLTAKHCIDQGVFHRDIKPSNILVNTKTMEVKLIDFGSGDLVKKSKKILAINMNSEVSWLFLGC